jgi:acyl-CoA thioesterase FadM
VRRRPYEDAIVTTTLPAPGTPASPESPRSVGFAGVPAQPGDAWRSKAEVPIRFEDVTQDGRFVLEALPNAIGPTIWRGILTKNQSFVSLLNAGVLPMLTRFVLEGTQGPFSANATVEAEGACRMVRTEEGGAARFALDIWADLYAPIGRTYGRAPRHGERALAGRMWAEQMFTRPFAAPGQRRVTHLEFEGAPEIRDSRPGAPSAASVASVPHGAQALEPGPRLHPSPIAIGIVHTDSNRHVNSLAYLRMFEEAAIQRFVELGKSSNWLGRSLEIVYRKPCFAGQTLHVVQQAFDLGGKPGIAATLVDAKDAASPETLAQARPHTYARILFDGPS